MIEVDGDLILVNGFHHTGQLGIGRIIENHQQPFGQLHVLKLRTRHDLHVLRVRLTKSVFRWHLKRALVASLEPENQSFKARQQAAITDFESGRGLFECAVDRVAVFQVQREMQGDFCLLYTSPSPRD